VSVIGEPLPNPHFPALRSGHRLFQRPSPPKIEDGGSKIEDRRWRIEDGGSKMEDRARLLFIQNPQSTIRNLIHFSGPDPGSCNGLHRESNFLAFTRVFLQFTGVTASA